MADPTETPPEDLGPGGTPTPTPEPGPTPTPQEPELRTAAELLATPGPEPASEPEPAPTPSAEDPTAARARTAADRIKELVVEKSSERRAREAAEARARLAEETLAEIGRLDPEIAQRLQQATGTPPTRAVPGAPAPQTFTRAQVEQAAAALAAQSAFNEQVNAAVIAGRTAHADYDAAVAGLKNLTGPAGPSTEFLQAALATGEASELVYRLGKDPSEADRLLNLPPAALGAQMERLAATLRAERAAASNAKAEPSKAPPAIAPRVSGRGTTAEMPLDDPRLPMAEYIKRRNEHEKRLRAG